MKRAAFIYHPYGEEKTRFEMMPFAQNVVKAVAKNDCLIDLFLWEPRSSVSDRLPKNVRAHFVSRPNLAKYGRLKPWLYSWWSRRPLRFPRYDLVFGLGQHGCYQAAILAKRLKIPWVYVNDEYPSTDWMETSVLAWEERYARSASALIIPDLLRGPGLRKMLPFLEDIPTVEVLNAPDASAIVRAEWHDRLGIPASKRIFLQAGNLDDVFQIPEILCSVPAWPEDAVLVVNGPNADSVKRAKRALAHLDMPGSVFWTDGNLSEPELNGLVAASTACFALYRARDANFVDTGKSSGKLLRSLSFDRPVIASALPSMEFVRKHGVGILVSHSVEIGCAVAAVLRDEKIFLQRCRDYRMKYMDPAEWEAMLMKLVRRLCLPEKH